MTLHPDIIANQPDDAEARPNDGCAQPVPAENSEPTHDQLDDKLDEALKESFPASDPIAISRG